MPVSIGVNMRVTGHYSQGGRKYMEDKFSVAYQQTEDEKDLEYAYFGIFDGHGGCEAADYAKVHLMDSIVEQRQFWSDNDEDVLRAIRNGYMMTHMNMWKELDKWPKTLSGLPSTAGTTASVAFIRGGKIYIGHVGDSAIVLGYQVEGQERWCARPLTLDHKPDSDQEMRRIMSSGGKVIAKAGVHRVVWNRPAVGPSGSLRCEEIPFLAVARSLGDLWSYNPNTDEFVVSPDPDVGVLVIDPSKYRCLIFGTDGLWNMVSAEAAVHLVQDAEKHNEKAPPGAPPPDAWLNPSKILVDSALQKWSNNKMRADNTSVVTLMMDPPGPPRNRANVHSSPLPTSAPVSHHSTEPPPHPQPQTVKEVEDSRRSTVSPTRSLSQSPSPEREPPSPSPAPSRSLSIVKRFPDERPPPPPPIGQPCTYTTVQEDEGTFITNYGSPSESYFIARLLNKTQIKNTLHTVYEEITSVRVVQEERDIVRVTNNNVEDKVVKTTVLQRTSIVPIEQSVSKESPVSPPEETVEEPVQQVSTPSDTPANLQENIQINEVSSSSPVDAPPKPKARKLKVAPQPSVDCTPCRSLRSHNTPQTAPRHHTRLANKGRQSLPSQPVMRRRNNGESKVPVAVHGSNSNSNSNVLVNNTRPKLSHDVQSKQQQDSRVQSKHSDVSVITKQQHTNEHKATPKPQHDHDGAQDTATTTRVTRSKDIVTASPADLLLKAVKDASARKQHSGDVNPKHEVDAPKVKEERPVIVTRQRNTTASSTPSISTPRTFLRRNALESENSKENILTPSTSIGPLKSAKRRNSGGGPNDLEPKEKRRTRLDDKRKSDKLDEGNEDVSSTDHNKYSTLMLGLNVASVVLHCVTELPNKRSLKSVCETDSAKSLRLRHKKEKKINVFDEVASTEVHSTTINLENEPLHSKTKSMPSNNRALRSRQDNVQSKIEEEKRSLRSAERNMEHADKECRPVLRSRNSVSGIIPKMTPRRIRAPWTVTPRQSLRKRLSK